ncbi:ABC-three component system protein [Corallococcus sp. AB045]|uniref:ABC-three component system protein n=1 Tax=Corallococcus sp. AB045 TaxID=2316719 RepID=UPI0011C3863D|nr:ABC-three component system protein [Corallococcus sp. AB045]
MTTDFSAAGSSLGYLYQLRYALLVLLERAVEGSLALESLDDVTFEVSGGKTELHQLKHHLGTSANLTDASPDLWKSLRVWSEQLASGSIALPGLVLTLVSTATASDDSACALLRPQGRDESKALEKLEAVAAKSKNQSLEKAIKAFLALTSSQRHLLVDAIVVLDASPKIIDVPGRIRKCIIYAVRPQHLSALYERIEGWWFNQAIVHLNKKSVVPIGYAEVHSRILDFSEQLRADSLPIDFRGTRPPVAADVDQDERLFVLQLKELGFPRPRIETAILDYYRAFEQRSRWVREDLVLDDELVTYEDRLVDEWSRMVMAIDADHDGEPKAVERLRKCGLAIYRWMEHEARIHIRERVSEPYVMRGSYHMLANVNPPRVWWHPTFLERLKGILATTAAGG